MPLVARRSPSSFGNGLAISEILGSILLVGITVVIVGALSLLIASIPGPVNAAHADLTVELGYGTTGWGTGDETVTIRHLGGESLRDIETSITIRINGTGTTYTGASLGGAFSDGRLRIGEAWSKTLSVPLNAIVEADVVAAGEGGSTIAATSSQSATCGADLDPPTANPIVQTPVNVQSTTVGAVVVTLTLVDHCAGVRTTSNPTLYYRLQDGTNPAFSNGGSMAYLGSNQWSGSIADPTWLSHLGKTLEWYATGLTDRNGNAGRTPTQSDLVDDGAAYAYATTHTATIGTATDFANAQSASDAGAAARFQEGAVAGSATSAYAASAVISSAGWTNPSNAFASDDAYATATAEDEVRFGLADQSPALGTISAVSVKAEVSITTFTNDGWRLRACMGATCNTQSPTIVGSAADTTITYDITSLRPGGGTWAWADVNALEILIRPQKDSGSDGTWRIDHAYLQVTYAATNYALDVQLDFSGVPSGSMQTLQLNYRTSGDTYRVEVWNGATWTTRGAALSSASMTTWSYTLTAAEYNQGAPRIRFMDATPTGVSQGDLYVDYARVRTI